MSKAKDKPAATNTNALRLTLAPDQTEGQALAAAAVLPAFNAAIAINAYQGNTLGDDVDLMALVEALEQSTDKAKTGDLSNLEAMLIGQATALQTIFTSLAKRAAYQTQLNQYQTFLGLALKAQAQSRATISALVDLKYPRQATFVKQANIAHGPQQVNNGTPAGTDVDQYAQARRHAEKSGAQQNELLEDARHGGTQMDTRATPAPARSNQRVETVEPVHRAAKRKG